MESPEHNITNKNIHRVKSVQIRCFLWSVFSRTRVEYGEIRSISPYSVRKFVKDKPFYIIATYVFHSLKSILQSHDSGRHEKYRLSLTQSKKFNQRKTLG